MTHTEYMREWRAKNLERAREIDRESARRHQTVRSKRWLDWYHRNRDRDALKVTARRLLGEAVQKGTIQRLPCQVCGASVTEAHHDDYQKPLQVEWLCKLHHEERHP